MYMYVYIYICIIMYICMFRMVHQFLIYLFGNPCKSDVISRHVRPNGTQWKLEICHPAGDRTYSSSSQVCKCSKPWFIVPMLCLKLRSPNIASRKKKYSMCATQFGKINTLLEKARINLQSCHETPCLLFQYPVPSPYPGVTCNAEHAAAAAASRQFSDPLP